MSIWFKSFFSKYRWYRRWYGGRWELWWVQSFWSDFWHDVSVDKCHPEYRPRDCFGTPTIEDYPIKGNSA